MIPFLMVPALVQQEAPALPPVFPVPDGLRIKDGSLRVSSYEQETFEMLKTLEQAPVRVPVKGRSWRFQLESSGARAGIMSLLQKFRPALLARGWTWQWEQRNVARCTQGSQDYWIKAGPSGGAALEVVLMQVGEPRKLTLTPPAATSEILEAEKDFLYLTPWPESVLVGWAQSQSPVGVIYPDGRQAFVGVFWLEKAYALKTPPSSFEFVTVYRNALLAAGWEIEGDTAGETAQVQAIYLKNGRDLRLTLRLIGDTMTVGAADVGAQIAADSKNKKKP